MNLEIQQTFHKYLITYACVGKINLEETLIDFVNALPSPSFGEILFTSFVVL